MSYFRAGVDKDLRLPYFFVENFFYQHSMLQS